MCFDLWIGAEEDETKSKELWISNAGEIIFYWDRGYLGTCVITRLFDVNGAQNSFVFDSKGL